MKSTQVDYLSSDQERDRKKGEGSYPVSIFHGILKSRVKARPCKYSDFFICII